MLAPLLQDTNMPRHIKVHKLNGKVQLAFLLMNH